MNIRKHSTKKDRTNDSFNSWIRQHCTIATYQPGKMKHSRFHTSYHDNKFKKLKLLNILFGYVIEQWPEICFRDFKRPKMNLLEHTTQIYIPDDSIKILIMHVFSKYRRSNHLGKMVNLTEFTHYITISNSQKPKL